mmetsp:Transcript_14884/g.45475  ORF Transcript_14884/g.45475 Transcript_14884/m.45475 type:complete len:489 (+) Transcript_14884:2412-3878(+)
MSGRRGRDGEPAHGERGGAARVKRDGAGARTGAQRAADDALVQREGGAIGRPVRPVVGVGGQVDAVHGALERFELVDEDAAQRDAFTQADAEPAHVRTERAAAADADRLEHLARAHKLHAAPAVAKPVRVVRLVAEGCHVDVAQHHVGHEVDLQPDDALERVVHRVAVAHHHVPALLLVVKLLAGAKHVLEREPWVGHPVEYGLRPREAAEEALLQHGDVSADERGGDGRGGTRAVRRGQVGAEVAALRVHDVSRVEGVAEQPERGVRVGQEVADVARLAECAQSARGGSGSRGCGDAHKVEVVAIGAHHDGAVGGRERGDHDGPHAQVAHGAVAERGVEVLGPAVRLILRAEGARASAAPVEADAVHGGAVGQARRVAEEGLRLVEQRALVVTGRQAAALAVLARIPELERRVEPLEDLAHRAAMEWCAREAKLQLVEQPEQARRGGAEPCETGWYEELGVELEEARVGERRVGWHALVVGADVHAA